MRCPVTNKFAKILLADDGTLDTVLQCSSCAAEFRYNFSGEDEEESYEQFVDWAIGDAAESHEEEGA